MDTLLAVDYNNLLYRNLHARGQLTDGKKWTGGLFGVFSSIAKLVNDYQCNRLVVCRDARPYYRHEIHPGYKANRNAAESSIMHKLMDAHEQLAGLFEILGVPVLHRDGWEADDWIGVACIKRHHRYRKIYLSSNDSDLCQLFDLSRDIVMCKKDGPYGRAEFVQEHGVPPKLWPIVTALTGGHNCLPGIPGVGPVRAKKIARENWTVKQIKTTFQPAMYERFRIGLQCALVPFPRCQKEIDDKVVRLPSFKLTEEYHRYKVIRYLARYGIQFTMAMDKAIERLQVR